MSDIFDKILHSRGRRGEKLFAINIGAMDGLMFDELSGYSNLYGFSGLYVEPIPYLFERLKSNLDSGKNIFENAAISTHNGTVEMLTIDQEAIDLGKVHSCFYGMSSITPPQNGLGSEGDREVVEKYGKVLHVPCLTLDSLFKKHNITSFDILKLDTEGHDFVIFNQLDLDKYRPLLIRMEWINLPKQDKWACLNKLTSYNYYVEYSGQDLIACPQEVFDTLDRSQAEESQVTEHLSERVTLVTGLWNIKRDSLTEGWSRSYQSYLDKFEQLLQIPNNLIVYGEQDLEEFVWRHRSPENTQFILREQKWFKNDIYEKVQKIRNNPDWYNQSGWLPESTQAKLDMYNPLVMSKMFLLNDARILDKFNSDNLYWIDAGIANTVHPGYFTHDLVLDKLERYSSKFSFICFPYKASTEIHGFSYPDINKYANANVEMVARGGFFGGPKEFINQLNGSYYQLLLQTLHDGKMGTEESLFSILAYKHPELVQYFLIEENGLLGTFFENLKNDSLEPLHHIRGVQKQLLVPKEPNRSSSESSVGLYVITYNSPNQFEKLVLSMIQYDENFIRSSKKYLLDNSINQNTYQAYKDLCEKYNFTHIKKDNIGICGGRQFIAEHAEEQELDAYFFFEDDMFFYPKQGEVCRNGFNRRVDSLFHNSIQILNKEGYDFLKLNYSEFYGDNGKQWAWYNVPQTVREQVWPDYSTLPEKGIDENSPRTLISSIHSWEGIPYASGEVYYSNWPQLVSKEGNRKMFLETKWAHPFEQTWMSHMFQETRKGNLKPGLLLISPTEHERFDHYPAEERREN